MSARSPLICSAVELWYKMMLEIRNQSDLTENHIKRKVAGSQRLSSNCLWLVMAAYKPSFADGKRSYCRISNHIIRNLTRYVRNEEDTLSYVLRKKIPGNLRIKSVLYSINSFQSFV